MVSDLFLLLVCLVFLVFFCVCVSFQCFFRVWCFVWLMFSLFRKFKKRFPNLRKFGKVRKLSDAGLEVLLGRASFPN